MNLRKSMILLGKYFRAKLLVSLLPVAFLSISNAQDVGSIQYQSKSIDSSYGVGAEGYAFDVLNYEFCKDAGLVHIHNGYDQLLGDPVQTRMGFLYNGNFGLGWQDEKDLSTIETLRGVSVALYGLNSGIRVVNIEPRLANENTEYRLSTFLRDDDRDSGYFRTSFEAQSPLYKGDGGDYLSYRFAASSSDWDGADVDHYTGQLRYKNQKVDGLVEFQTGDFESLGLGLEETNVLANFDYAATEALTFTAGVFLTDLENSEEPDSSATFSTRRQSETEEYRIGSEYRFETGDLFGRDLAKHSVGVTFNEYIRENQGGAYGEDSLNSSRIRTLGTLLHYNGEWIDGKLGINVGYRVEDYRFRSDVEESSSEGVRLDTRKFDDEENLSISLNYELSDSVQMYANFSDGAAAVSSSSLSLGYQEIKHREVGIKFDAFEGRLFGRLGVYQTDENTEGGVSDLYNFSGIVTRYYNTEGVVSLGADFSYLEEAGRSVDLSNLYGENVIVNTFNGEAIVGYEDLDKPVQFEDGENPEFTWRSVIEKAFEDVSDSSAVVGYSESLGSESDFYWLGENESTLTKEKTNGVDLNLSFLIQHNWEILLKLSHQSKDYESFRLPETSESAFGSEYDSWVRTFGRDAFGLEEVYETNEYGETLYDSNGNPIVKEVIQRGNAVSISDPLRIDRNTVFAQDLTYLTLHSDYSFYEGSLSGLSILAGLVFRDSNTEVVEGSVFYDQFPYSSEYFAFNFGLKYEWQVSNMNFRVQLNIDNATEETAKMGYWYNQLDDGSFTEETTDVRLYPRTYQLRFTAEF
ncbi:hypothetical protein MLD52_05770 [Puniceicoccaceae bacterium K14]|nr:hypothetical protein [Puniceicoccaceae bacterium K14]